ncbi:MAG: 2-dehydro-3-deoxygalactonokinase [Fusobacteriaceae bacterium]|jgi:2-dehydro-3-deoxygalactonokinase|nr:2-dehydro-3-deoxygalactonokinase [Fusobacteriaceae bacterium]
MEKKIVAIDAGTSNVRIRITEGGVVIARAKSKAGVKIGKKAFAEQLYALLTETLSENRVDKNDIEGIFASGMITSPLGLAEVPHEPLPVSAETLARRLRQFSFGEFALTLIPGVKKAKDELKFRGLNLIDVIRGEETEIIGVMAETGLREPALLILPGSHNKFVEASGGEILDFTTTLSGELLEALTKHTILEASVDGAFAEALDPDFLRTGLEAGRRYGINRGAFMLRGLDLREKLTLTRKQNFLLGLVLSGDLDVLAKNYYAEQYRNLFVVGGGILAKGLYTLISGYYPKNVVRLLDSDEFSVKGVLEIAGRLRETHVL